MRLVPLEVMPEGSASASQYIRCCKTGVTLSWNEAARKHWQADLDGEPYQAYYSPQGLGEVMKVYNISFGHRLQGGGDPWCIMGEVYGHPRFKDGDPYCPSIPVAFDEENLIVTNASGKKYQICSFRGDKGAFIEELKKTIERGYWEVH